MMKWEYITDKVCRSTCKVCGAYVDVNVKPALNEIDIGGSAVALICYPRPVR